MSKHNRQRRLWKCQGCGAQLFRDLARSAQNILDLERLTHNRIIHACGVCKTCHYQDGEGVRKLTPAEMLKLHVEVPLAMERLERARYEPSDTPRGELVIGKE